MEIDNEIKDASGFLKVLPVYKFYNEETEKLDIPSWYGRILVHKIIKRSFLQTENVYAYCPYCTKRAKRTQKENWRASSTKLILTDWYTAIQISETEAKQFYENNVFFCMTCKKEITYDDFKNCGYFNAPVIKDPIIKISDLRFD